MGKLNLQSETFKAISEDAKNLLSLLLEYDYTKRITAEKALIHRYFTEEKGEISDLIMEKRISNLNNFKVL